VPKESNGYPDFCAFRWWNSHFAERKFNLLVDQSAARDRARLRCIKSDSASSWLEPCPASALGLSLVPAEFVVLCKWWLGISIVPPAQVVCPSCGDAADCWGDHFLCCKQAGFYLRHNTIAQLVSHMAEAAGFVVLPGVQIYDDLRPADIMLSFWKGGRPLAIDISVCHPLAPSKPIQAIDNGVARASEVEDEKHHHYDPHVAAAHLQFTPFVLHHLRSARP